MKKNICLVLALLMLLAAIPAVADDAVVELDQIMAKGSIVIATEGAWAPWTYHDETDKLVGFDVEVAELIAAKLGVQPEFAEVEWDGIFAGIDSRRFDVAANGVEITDERAMKYDFSKPYAYIRTALVVRGDNETITSFEDLNGVKTSNSIGSTYQEIAESFGASCDNVDTLDETIQMVIYGRVDATLNAEVSIYDYLAAHPEADIKIVALTEEASQVAIPVRKNSSTVDNTTLLEAINQAIDELTASGELSAISMKYFGSDISPAAVAQ